MTTLPTTIPRQLRLYLAYGLGDAGPGLATTVLGFYLFPFLRKGAMPMVINGWDALTDPVIGWLSGRTRSTWGARLSWIGGSAIPLGLCFSAIWWVPPGQRLAYYSVMGLLMMTAYTAMNLSTPPWPANCPAVPVCAPISMRPVSPAPSWLVSWGW